MFKTQTRSWLKPSVKEVPAQRCRCPKISKESPIRCWCDEYERMAGAVGDGKTSTVGLLRRRKTGVVYAAKQFKNFSGKKEKTYATNVLAEFYIADGLRHPNIIQTYNLCTIDGALSMVMEYAPQNLLDLSASGILTDDAENYFQQLVAGVAYIHSTGFAHRDIKLENVLVKDGQIKIIDFGTISTGKWMPTADVGSLPYMAPELFSASHYSPQAADVWSLAILYVCMILQRFPWSAAKEDRPAFNVYACASKSSDAAWPITECPAHMRKVLSLMLQIGPKQRPMLEGVPVLLRESAKQE
ncbi:putative serine/threonine-protein kinase RTK1 [Cyphellophora attinorum]|uniref:Putative serine/threonine-protein kinase RTK1 n=1 Tax=Cyphellophora attinorum TaxID=1664694 RepID=A0A0N1H2Q8_9EURO|nr:putative serine/threonine-protein kinase RTK1 [Phialophora attinorum]KPI34763.1 putative serine/threonine-protein kinase RTK1 [Phialophora attinorum]